MADESRYLIQTPDGRVFGPATVAEIIDWAKQGSLPTQSIAIEETTGNRMPVSAIPGLMDAVPGGGLEFFIPRNTWALVSYYSAFLAILGFFCYCLPGMAIGALSIGAGIAGLRFASLNPEAKGAYHCYFGIAVGALCILVGLGFMIFGAVMIFGA